jgi:hypothetical protein
LLLLSILEEETIVKFEAREGVECNLREGSA